MNSTMKIGIFDSGYGGLTILNAVRSLLPQYDYIYLGDNAASPYGTRSFEIIYQYTWRAVQFLFSQDCILVILACNTASAKALRSIQQLQLPIIHKNEARLPFQRRVLGVIRPTVEAIDENASHVGILATQGTVSSQSYVLELLKINPRLQIVQQACPLWVPLIESNEYTTDGANFFIKKYLARIFEQDDRLDTLILACTHYPIILPQISLALQQMYKSKKIAAIPNLITQGQIVARALENYLERHSEIRSGLSLNQTCTFYTTETKEKFQESASVFMQEAILAQQIHLSGN